MQQSADEHGITSIALHHIGSDHGGLEVAQVRAAIGSVFDSWTGTINLYSPLGTPYLQAQHEASGARQLTCHADDD
jgi:hypothetical protein